MTLILIQIMFNIFYKVNIWSLDKNSRCKYQTDFKILKFAIKFKFINENI